MESQAHADNAIETRFSSFTMELWEKLIAFFSNADFQTTEMDFVRRIITGDDKDIIRALYTSKSIHDQIVIASSALDNALLNGFISEVSFAINRFKEYDSNAKEDTIGLFRQISVWRQAANLGDPPHNKEIKSCVIIKITYGKKRVEMIRCEDNAQRYYPDIERSDAYPDSNLFAFYDTHVLTKLRSGAWVPATIRRLSNNVPKALLTIILPMYAGKSLLYKDFLREDYYPPLPISSISEYYNKKDFFEKQFRMTLPSTAGKHSAINIFKTCCSLPYITKESVPTIWNNSANSSGENLRRNRKREIAQDYLTDVICKMLPTMNDSIVYDYVYLSLKYNQKINLNLGKKGILRIHNQLTQRYVKSSLAGKIVTIPETPLKYIELPPWFKRLETPLEFYMEGVINANCVATYIDYVVDGDCIIYSADYEGEHMTVEIDLAYSGYDANPEIFFNVEQCCVKYNRPPSKKARNCISAAVMEATEKAKKKYGETMMPGH